jgi:hypothetical protein
MPAMPPPYRGGSGTQGGTVSTTMTHVLEFGQSAMRRLHR